MLLSILARHFVMINMKIMADFCFAGGELRGGNRISVVEGVHLHCQATTAHFKAVHLQIFSFYRKVTSSQINVFAVP
jgi:hypothetical protein